jgi:glycosyltransferase involved in cell wall biosynthesis
MACGTPVIANRRGSMTELITDSTTGFLVDDLDGAVRAVHAAGTLDRQSIRDQTIRQFDRATMVDQYLAVYHAVLAGRTSIR